MSDALLYVGTVVIVVLVAMFVVPIVMKRVVERDAERRDAWIHAHETHVRKHPSQRRGTSSIGDARARESEDR